MSPKSKNSLSTSFLTMTSFDPDEMNKKLKNNYEDTSMYGKFKR